MTAAFGSCVAGTGGDDGDGNANNWPTTVASSGGLSGIDDDTNGFLVGVFLDATEPFFDLRAADTCEVQSPHEYPPPGRGEASRPGP